MWDYPEPATHPQIPTQRYVRKNLMHPSNHIGIPHLYKLYPYKKTRSGRRDAIVADKELTDHEYSLIQSEWTKLIRLYMYTVCDYMLSGAEYKINHHLGRISMVKTKKTGRYQTHIDGKQVIRKHVNRWLEGHKVNIQWRDKKFRFQSIYFMLLTKGSGKYVWNRLKKEAHLIHNLNNHGRRLDTLR